MTDRIPGLRVPSQEFLTVLESRRRPGDPVRYRSAQEAADAELVAKRLDLHNTDFSGVDLSDIWWIECTMDGSRLTGASMPGTRAYDSSWNGCDLTEAQLPKSEIEDCTFAGARLIRANALRLVMHRCVLSGADLSEARLDKASIFSSDLSRVTVRDAVFDRLSLIDCVVVDMDLAGTSGTVTQGLRINVATAEHPNWLEGLAALEWLRSAGGQRLELFNGQL